MHRITPALRDYAWGTTDDIPRLLGIDPTGGPVAEAWWGGHRDAPSLANVGGDLIGLDSLIAADRDSWLGPDAAFRWDGRLPFLLKVLAIARPLSIQVHPDLEQARAGFERERTRDSDAPRDFHDAWHKPEMVVALTPMTVLAGVRPIDDLRADLDALGTAGAARLGAALSGDVSDFISLALTGGGDEATLAALAARGRSAPAGSSLRVSADALGEFPGDAGALVALALNVVQLRPGDAAYTGAGVLHSYQSGVGIEVMANSDNVVRAGLTPKHVDVPLLLELASTSPAPVARPQVMQDGPVTTYLTQSDEFALTVVSDGRVEIPAGPRVALVVEGEASISCDDASEQLTCGQAVVAGNSDGTMRVSGRGMTVIAHLPQSSPRLGAAVS